MSEEEIFLLNKDSKSEACDCIISKLIQKLPVRKYFIEYGVNGIFNDLWS